MDSNEKKEGVTFGEFMEHVNVVSMAELEGMPVIKTKIFRNEHRLDETDEMMQSMNAEIQAFMYSNEITRNDVIEYRTEITLTDEKFFQLQQKNEIITVILSYWSYPKED